MDDSEDREISATLAILRIERMKQTNGNAAYQTFQIYIKLFKGYVYTTKITVLILTSLKELTQKNWGKNRLLTV